METILVIIIVAVVVVLVSRSFCRTLTGKKSGCNCTADCSDKNCAESPQDNDKS